MKQYLILIFVIFVLLSAVCPAKAEDEKTIAEAILKSAGVKSGIAVHIGCREGKLTAELVRGSDLYIHGLDQDQKAVDRARVYLQSLNLYSRSSAERSSFEKLPYADNLINLIIIDDLSWLLKQKLSLQEVMRVLVPNGKAVMGEITAKLSESDLKRTVVQAGIKDVQIITKNGIWALVQKLRPPEMDEWSHARHAPDSNPVSGDRLVGPAQQLQWIAPPIWGHHRGPDGAVSAGGRVFFVLMDRPLNLGVIGRFYLTARDAFNGRLLWKKQVEAAKTQYSYGATLPIGAMVAAKDRLFVVLKTGKPLKALDSETGKELKSYDEHPSPDYLLYLDEILILITRGEIRAVEKDTGKLLWKRAGGLRIRKVLTSTVIAAGEGNLFFCQPVKKYGPLHLIALDVKSGKETWTKNTADLFPDAKGRFSLHSYYKGNILFSGGGHVYAVSSKDGVLCWKYAAKKAGRIYGLRDSVWISQHSEWQGLDLATGQPTELIKAPKKLPPNIKGKRIMDGQCNFPLATERFFITHTRMSMVDTKLGVYFNSMFTRAPCKFLLAIPANGLIYTFPKDCGCYPCLRGLLTYAPVRPTTQDDVKGKPSYPLEKGPAYNAGTGNRKPETGKEDWGMHRYDGQRGAASPALVPGTVKAIWTKTIGSKISAPTIADGKVFVASIDEHQVRAFNEKTGEPVWTFTAGGRIDSPPSVYKGLCVFGSRDGWVYCVRSKDGVLVWRLRAAPYERRIGVWDQLESAWPVHGTVLIYNDTVFCSAGRHANAEAGIKVHGIDLVTGKLKWTNGPTYEIVNDVLSLTPRKNIYLGKYKVAYNAETGKGARDNYKLKTYYAGMLTETAGPAWGGADLMAFDAQRTVKIYSGVPVKKNHGMGRSHDKPGSGYEISLSVPDGKNAKTVWKLDKEMVRFNSLVLTKDAVFAAGGLEFAYDPKAENPWAFLDGDKGGKLIAYSAADGSILGKVELTSLPVFDGLAAANGKLFLCTKDGKVTCYGK